MITFFFNKDCYYDSFQRTRPTQTHEAQQDRLL
jgi:hypothetical protein